MIRILLIYYKKGKKEWKKIEVCENLMVVNKNVDDYQPTPSALSILIKLHSSSKSN